MPAEFATHERTLMAWPRRRALWGDQIGQAKQEYAQTANAIAAFEPLTMVCADAGDAAEARAVLTQDNTEIVEIAIDDSWVRDSGPIFVLTPDGARVGVHFAFNAWGEKFTPWAADEAAGGALAERYGDRVVDVPLVLEGGSIAVDGQGTLVTTEQCLLHPSRNPACSREDIEVHLRAQLGVQDIVWLGQGLEEDRDTDGHVDLIAAFTTAGALLLQSVAADNPNHEACAENHARARAAGLEVLDFPLLAYTEVAGEAVVASYLNLYVCNGAVIVPVTGAPTDGEALQRIAVAYPEREVVAVDGAVLAYGGGGPHCITQQVPGHTFELRDPLHPG